MESFTTTSFENLWLCTWQINIVSNSEAANGQTSENRNLPKSHFIYRFLLNKK